MEILIPLEGTSVTGLQAKELMGLTVNSVNELSDSDVQSFEKFYEELYVRAFRALMVDAQKVLSGFYRFDDGSYINGKFNFNAKFTTVESSEYDAGSIAPTIISVDVDTYLSMYSQLVINWVEFNAVTFPGLSTTFKISIINTVTGEEYSQSVTRQLVIGINRIPLLVPIASGGRLRIQIEFIKFFYLSDITTWFNLNTSPPTAKAWTTGSQPSVQLAPGETSKALMSAINPEAIGAQMLIKVKTNSVPSPPNYWSFAVSQYDANQVLLPQPPTVVNGNTEGNLELLVSIDLAASYLGMEIFGSILMATITFQILSVETIKDTVIRPTSQRFYNNGLWIDEDVSCRCPMGNGSIIVKQSNPGLNVQMTGVCSLERFISYNFALFQFPLYYSIGREFMKERIASDRINQYTVLTIDRANQLLTAYEKDYVNALTTLRDINSVSEDMNCFTCKKPVFSNNLLP